MLGIETNVRNLIGWVWLFISSGRNVKDGYECYEFDKGWVWLLISSGYKC